MIDPIKHIILGAGGAGRTIAGACQDLPGGIAFLDDQISAVEINGLPVLGPLTKRTDYPKASYIIGFGSRYQEARSLIYREMLENGFQFFSVISPFTYIDRFAHIGKGVFLGAQSAVLPNAALGDNCYLCSACTVDHDVILGEGVYLSPGVKLAGGVKIGEGAFIGANAAVVPGVQIGAWATIGAGTVVLHDVAPGDVIVGNPGRSIKKP